MPEVFQLETSLYGSWGAAVIRPQNRWRPMGADAKWSALFAREKQDPCNRNKVILAARIPSRSTLPSWNERSG